ncbi:MAG: acyltransferase [Opitutaceae bacterium]|nr:acyltransferase [Opitutaceae bacterium]MBP9912487.1 acyltransferase [Opitutaceae bacterium]
MSQPKPRLAWIDNLRTFAILLVVNMHACVTYSHVGDWYTMSAREPSLAEKVPFLFWQGHLQAFFMGLLFFVSGYFAQLSLTRKGPAAFLRERVIRLGLPTLLYMLVIHPFILLGLNPWHADFPPAGEFYAHYLSTGKFIGSSGPLWFAFALLIFCTLLATWHALRPAVPASSFTPPAGAARLWRFGLILVLATFLVRIVQPVGTSWLNFQFCFFAQYVAAFLVGLAAAQHGWLIALAASPVARRAGWLALIGGPLLLATVMFLGGPPTGKDAYPYNGGWHPQAVGLALWEQLAGLGLSLGLLAHFSTKFNGAGRLARWLADRSFGVYVLHAPVLVALTIALRPWESASPYLLVALLTTAGLIGSFLLADLARRIPGLRSIL